MVLDIQVTGSISVVSLLMQSRSRRARFLLGTALIGAAFSLGGRQSAWANCGATDGPNFVVCFSTSTTDTTNTNGAAFNTGDRLQTYNINGTVNATVGSGVVITGNGLAIESTQAGATVTVTNDGSVTANGLVPPTAGGSAALQINANGGLITYTGNGSVANTPTASSGGGLAMSNTGTGGIAIGGLFTPVIGTFAGNNGIVLSTADGIQNVFLSGGTITLNGTAAPANDDGIRAVATGSGAANLQILGGTTINHATLGTNFHAGLSARSGTGDVNVNTNANVGGANNAVQFAVLAQTTGGGVITVTQTGGTMFFTQDGLHAQNGLAGAGNVTVNANGGTLTGANLANTTGVMAFTAGTATGNVAVNLGGTGMTNVVTGIEARNLNAASAGTVTVIQTAGSIAAALDGIIAESNGSGTVDVTTSAGSSVGVGGGASTGITARSTGTGAVTVTSGGILTTGVSSGTGVHASIANAASLANVTVHQNASITAGTTAVTATTTGTGKVSVDGTAMSIFGGLYGIDASSRSGGVLVTVGGTVTGVAGSGVRASAIGGGLITITNEGTITGAIGVQTVSGNATVTNRNQIVGTGANGVQLAGANNLFIMEGTSAALTGLAIGSGTDTFRIGGTGSNSFNGSQIGSGWLLLDKAGSSTWTLTGTSTYAGPTTVSAGTLLVNGSLAQSTTTVNNGAALGGNGIVGATTINSGGALSPGNSIGVINVNGNLVLGAGAIYIVEVSPTDADRTSVSGTAQLGGELRLIFEPGSYTARNYTILSAAVGRTGMFNTVTAQNLPSLLRADIVYTSTDVLLVTLTSQIANQLAGGTGNQRAVANAQDAIFNGGLPSILALLNLPLSQLPKALDQLSGEVHSSTASVLADESLYARSAILGRLRQASYGGTMGAMASLTMGGPQAFADGEELNSSLAYAKSPIVRKAPMLAPQPTSDTVFWAQAFGAWGRFNGDDNATSVRRDLAGFFTGIDTSVAGNGRVGIAAGYTGSKNNLEGRGSANVETGHIAGYGGWGFGALNLRAGGDFAFHNINTDRTINFPGFFDRTFANYDGNTGQVFGELGYGFALGNIALEPFAGAAWVRVKSDGVAERGGAAALNFAGTNFETGYTTLGIRAASMVPVGHDMILISRASLAWQHTLGDVAASGVLAFQNAPTIPFAIQGAPIARDSLLAEAGVDVAINPQMTFGVSYTGQIARNVADHGAKGKFSYRF